MRVCGIDPGISNLGVCVAEQDENDEFHIIELQKVNLFQQGTQRYKYESKQLSGLVYRFVRNNHDLFATCDMFLIENQMAHAMYKVQFGLECILHDYGKVVPVHPATVKAFFKTATKKYKTNKNAAVHYCKSQLSGPNLSLFRRFTTGTKADDVADATMLAKYGVMNYENLQQVRLTAFEDCHTKKKRKRKGATKKSKKKITT